MYSNLSFKERIECLYSNVKWNNLVLAQVMQLFYKKMAKGSCPKLANKAWLFINSHWGPHILKKENNISILESRLQTWISLQFEPCYGFMIYNTDSGVI